MLTPSVFGKDFFDDFDDLFDFPFWDDRDMKRLEKKLYGRRGKNLMKTDINFAILILIGICMPLH